MLKSNQAFQGGATPYTDVADVALVQLLCDACAAVRHVLTQSKFKQLVGVQMHLVSGVTNLQHMSVQHELLVALQATALDLLADQSLS